MIAPLDNSLITQSITLLAIGKVITGETYNMKMDDAERLSINFLINELIINIDQKIRSST